MFACGKVLFPIHLATLRNSPPSPTVASAQPSFCVFVLSPFSLLSYSGYYSENLFVCEVFFCTPLRTITARSCGVNIQTFLLPRICPSPMMSSSVSFPTLRFVSLPRLLCSTPNGSFELPSPRRISFVFLSIPPDKG